MIQTIIKNIIKREGGYVNHPADRGGPTKYGVTEKALTHWSGRTVTEEDIKNISKTTAYEIFYHQYFIIPKIDTLPQQLHEIMLDMSVNHGFRRAIRILQRTLTLLDISLKVDGYIGPITLNAVDDAISRKSLKNLINNLIDARVAFYDQIIKNDSTQTVFRNGWINRAESFRESEKTRENLA